ncbi:hypothetical protein FGO68_gene13968 [Halteria grandinella]|uniref:Uncharacterized protein n=1 Tax=Halteria grandinella TaxID=5974 RepID=A0A8J8SXZ0_HALGN|nr:hypothetical protein FGO68_gene13968 [Halteria grandinella]
MEVFLLLLAITLHKNVHAINCLQKPFPIVFGGYEGDTSINSFDYSEVHQYLVAVGGTSDQSLHGFTDLPTGTQVPFIAVYRAEDMVLTWAKAYYLPDYAFSKVAASQNSETFATITTQAGPSAGTENFVMFVNFITGYELSVIAHPNFPTYEVLLLQETNLYLSNQLSISFNIVTHLGVGLVTYGQDSFFHFSRKSPFQYRAYKDINMGVDSAFVTNVELQNKGGMWIWTACAPYLSYGLADCLPKFADTLRQGAPNDEDIYFVTQCPLEPSIVMVSEVRFLYNQQLAVMPIGLLHIIDTNWVVINFMAGAKLILLYSCKLDNQMFISQFNLNDGTITISPLMQPHMSDSGILKVRMFSESKIFMGFKQTKSLSFLQGGVEYSSEHTFGSIITFQPANQDYCYSQSPSSISALALILIAEPNFQAYSIYDTDLSCPFPGFGILTFTPQNERQFSLIHEIPITNVLKIDGACPPSLQKSDFNSVDQIFNYVITDRSLIQGLDQYLLSTKCQGQIIFDTFINGVKAKIDSSFHIDPFLSLIVVDRFVKTGIYSIKLAPQYVPTVIQGTYYSLKLDIIKNAGPPLFEEVLQQSLEINQGDSVNLMLPQINDPDDDQFQIRMLSLLRFVNWGQSQSHSGIRLQKNMRSQWS